MLVKCFNIFQKSFPYDTKKKSVKKDLIYMLYAFVWFNALTCDFLVVILFEKPAGGHNENSSLACTVFLTSQRAVTQSVWSLFWQHSHRTVSLYAPLIFAETHKYPPHTAHRSSHCTVLVLVSDQGELFFRLLSHLHKWSLHLQAGLCTHLLLQAINLPPWIWKEKMLR